MRADFVGSATILTRGRARNEDMRSSLTAVMQNRRSEMADRELIAAILTAGMLPTLEIPRSRAHGSRRPVSETEGEDIQRAVGHAIGLYRSVLEGLGVDPFAGLPGHDTSRQ